MRRGSAAHNPGVSLFPFLAVLICTMGVMMLLLVIINRPGAAAIDDSEPPPGAVFEEGGKGSAATVANINGGAASAAADELKNQREMLDWRISQLQISRDKTIGDLRNERLRLTTVEDAMRKLRGQWELVTKAAGDIEQADKAKDHDKHAVAAFADRLKSELNATHDKLGKAINDARSQPPAYAIVPYDGPNGTRRQPIYIECRSDAIVLQPEGIALTENDFKGPKGPGNPLASTIRAARDFLAGGTAPAPGGEPYPLLIVRSNGIEGFYMARSAMSSWASDFGYELIEADRKLAFQPRNPQLAQVEQAALADARSRYAWFATTRTGQEEQQTRAQPVYRVSRNSGGIVREGEASFADADGPTTASGTGASGFGGSGSGFGLPGTGGASNGTGTRIGSGVAGTGFGNGNGTGNGNGYGTGPGTGSAASGIGFGSGSGNGVVGANGGTGFGLGGSGNGTGGFPGGSAGGSGIGAGTGSGNGNGNGNGVGLVGGNGAAPGVGYGGMPSGGGTNGSGYGTGVAGGPNVGPSFGPSGGSSGGPYGTVGWPIGSSSGNGGSGTGNTGAGGTGVAAGFGVPGGSTLGNAATPGGNGMNGSGIPGASGNGVSGASAGGPSAGFYPSGAQNTGYNTVAGTSGTYPPSGFNGTSGVPAGNSSAGQSGPAGAAGGMAGDPNSMPSSGSSAGNLTLGQAGGASGAAGASDSGGAASAGPMSLMMQGKTSAQPSNSDTNSSQTTPYPLQSGPTGPHPGEYVDSQPTTYPDKPKPQDDTAKKSHDSLAEKRGHDWSLPSQAKLSTPVSRIIHIECRGDCLILKPDFGNPKPRVIPFGPRTVDSVDKLVAAVWDYTKGWGIAGRQMYWKPRLELELGLSGEGRYSELQSLLANSGLEVARKQSTAATAPQLR